MYSRKVIKIRAEDSPNVRLALAQIAAGQEPTGETLVPGVVSWADYQQRRREWSADRQLWGLDAEFPDDAQVLLFPATWLLHSERVWLELEKQRRKRVAKAIGIDPGEGSANSCWAVGDEFGLLELVSKLTPDTNDIGTQTVALARKWNVPPSKWVYDRGGGGKQIADRQRATGYRDIQTVGFGETLKMDVKSGMRLKGEKIEHEESKGTYKNRRCQMYGGLHEQVDPGFVNGVAMRRGYGLPPPSHGPQYQRLRNQLAPIPKMYDPDGEGKLWLPSKKEMIETIYLGEGSPDEADAVVLMLFGMTHKVHRAVAGVA